MSTASVSPQASPTASKPPPQEVVVEVRDLVASYGDQRVLNGVDMTVRRGEVMIILGGSGSGKSTLMKCILGILRPDAGTVRVLGKDIWNVSNDERDEIYKQVGIVYQSGALFGSLSVAENVAFPLREHFKLAAKIVDITVRMKLGLVGLSGFEDRLPGELSGGQAKRVAFARAIAMDPKILFCDEPSAGLDPRIARGIDDLFLKGIRPRPIVADLWKKGSVDCCVVRIGIPIPIAGVARRRAIAPKLIQHPAFSRCII